MKWKSLLKTVGAGMALGAAAGSADAITHQIGAGRVDSTSLKGAAMGGAIAGAIGYWLRSPRERPTPANDVPQATQAPETPIDQPRN